MTRLLALAPLGMEAAAVRRGARQAEVARVGMGPQRAAAGAAALLPPPADVAAVAVTGLGGGLRPDLPVGHLVVADRVLRPDGRVTAELPGASLLAAELRRAGLPATAGPVVSTDHVVRGEAARAALAKQGALVVDMESADLLAADWSRPMAVVRAVSDGPGHELVSPRLPVNLRRALRSLREAVPVLEAWAAACRRRRVVLAEPRSFCAGVERAIATVEAALDRFGTPVYVRRQIVHNDHVVADLEQRGAVFVQELDEVPGGATVVFSAHGVGRATRAEAGDRDLRVVDATCPLVAKVHTEVRRLAEQGREVVLIGHDGHDEVEGTLGEVAGVHLIATPEEAAALDLPAGARVGYATQTTLAPDEVASTVAVLADRFSDLVGPRASDICYATHNRQEAVRAIATECDLVVVVGSASSSNSRRLVEVARRSGGRAELIDDETGLRLDWLAAASSVGVTAGASAPDLLVQRVVDTVESLGPVELTHHRVRRETVSFPLPPEVR
ncbi:MAG TPA: 4-hydroxy-3-methylbut-2-enyl diphosphate reductase [Acidimicrobiales bacterium]|nr:4-hydroxy-3-methylbut-2-enyl diphosphate reductase [Acidimicrobiales bacterium]